MKFQIMSDLHLEFHDYTPSISPEADVLILAGDIHNGQKGVEWANKNVSIPVIYVPGNHEYYGGDLADPPVSVGNACVLNNCVDLINDGDRTIGIFGSTLWTDFKRMGTNGIEGFMNDYWLIKNHGVQLDPQATIIENQFAVSKLQLAKRLFEMDKMVVVTHHSPSYLSMHPKFQMSPHNGAFHSDLDHLTEGVDLWVHGHTHDATSYMIGDCRVVCNPRGYPGEGTNFNDQCIVEV